LLLLVPLLKLLRLLLVMLFRLLLSGLVGIPLRNPLIFVLLLLLEFLPLLLLLSVEFVLLLLIFPIATGCSVRGSSRALHRWKVSGMHRTRSWAFWTRSRVFGTRSRVFWTSMPAAAIRWRVISSSGLFGGDSVVELGGPGSCGYRRFSVVVGRV
jgi:hypothetical protein